MRRTLRRCSTKTASRGNWISTTSNRSSAVYLQAGNHSDSRLLIFRLITDALERCAHCESERLSRLSQDISSAVQNLRLLEGVVAGCARGEHVSCDRRFRGNVGIQDQRVICVINAERRIYDRQQYLQLHAG